MTTEDFNKIIKRHITLKEYSKAFALCLSSLVDPELRDEAARTGKELIKQHRYEVLDGSGSKRSLTVPLPLTMDWIVDTAISLGYKTMEKGTISTGLFSSVPCVMIGSLLAKQKFGLRTNKNNTVTLLYSFGPATGDYKLINALCTDIIEELLKKM